MPYIHTITVREADFDALACQIWLALPPDPLWIRFVVLCTYGARARLASGGRTGSSLRCRTLVHYKVFPLLIAGL